jgi:DnaK suppressor protein
MAKETALKLQAHTDAELGQTQLEDLAARMTEKRRELTERVENLEQEMVVKDDCSQADAADAASAQENRLRANGMVEQHRQAIKEIDVAFRRLENGSYGVSEATGEPIDYKRLMLIPWARIGADEKESK